jgi:hypothetical protein
MTMSFYIYHAGSQVVNRGTARSVLADPQSSVTS